jgi:hypothetical protein
VGTRVATSWNDQTKTGTGSAVPTGLDNGERLQRKLLVVVVHRLILALKRQ